MRGAPLGPILGGERRACYKPPLPRVVRAPAVLLLIDPSFYVFLKVALAITLLVISLGIHEAAHGWVALRCGDPTARDLGRITLNPIAHIDPFMTIFLPAVMYFTVGVAFGGAKPVPVNYYNLRHPLRDMALVAIAGPLSNVLLAAFFFFCQKVLVDELAIWNANHFGSEVLSLALYSNLLLAAFNLLPIPPLDGSRVMTWLLPSGLREPYVRLESMGLLLVFLLWNLGPVKDMVDNTMRFLYRGISSVVSLGGLW